MCAEASWASRPRIPCEFADRAEIWHEDRVARPEQFGIQVRALAKDEGDHAPIAPAGLTVVLVDERLGADRTRSVGELRCLARAGLSDLGTIHEREADPGGADVERVAVHDVGDGVRRASGSAPTLRASRWRITSRRVAR